MVKLTARQQQVLDFIRSSLEETGFPPTRAEIATELGFKSPNAAEEHLKALARKGAIEMMPGASRGLRIVEEANLGLPIIGRVAAGEPILAQEHINDYCEIPPSFFKPEADFLLEVHGDIALRRADEQDGDALVCIHFSEDAKASLQAHHMDVARVMLEAGVRKVGELSGMEVEREDFDAPEHHRSLH